MSPEIQWRVKDSSSEQALATTPSAPAARWRASLVVLMLVLGAGLGLVYSSIKEPAPQLTPTALPAVIPTTILPSVFDTIDREAQALADGDFKVFLSVQDQSDPRWLQAQSRNFQAWGRPSLKTAPLYYFVGVQPDSLPHDRTALDTLQYRNGAYFRQTRFYRWQGDHWLRTAPDLSFWSGAVQTRTQHFDISYPVEDGDLILIVMIRLEAIYAQVCTDLVCPPDLRIPIIVSPLIDHFTLTDNDQSIVLPSPRIAGLYTGIDSAALRGLADPVRQQIVQSLIPLLAQKLSGDAGRWTHTGQGQFYLQAVEAWEANRLSAQPDSKALLPPPELSNNIPLVKLESLWTMQSTPSNPEQVANSVIIFIEQKYSVEGVAKFLKAIGPAQSFKQVIKNSLGLDEIQFEHQWQDWLKQLYAQGS